MDSPERHVQIQRLALKLDDVRRELSAEKKGMELCDMKGCHRRDIGKVTTQNESSRNQIDADRRDTVQQDISPEIECLRLQSKLDMNQMAIDKLKKRNAKLKELALATSPALEELDTLREQLAAKEMRCYGMEQKFDAQRKMNQDLKEQLAIDREKNETTNNRLKSLKSDLDITRSELEEQRTQNEIQRNEIEQQSQVHNQLMREKAVLGRENEELHQRGNELVQLLETTTLNYHAMEEQYDKQTKINLNLRNQLFISYSPNSRIMEFKEQKAENDGKYTDRSLNTVWKSHASPLNTPSEHVDVDGFSDGEKVRDMPCYEDLMEKQRELLKSESETDFAGNRKSGDPKILRIGDEAHSSVRHPAFSKAEPYRKSRVVTLKCIENVVSLTGP